MHEGRIVAGKYRILRLVAKGSMGEVYEAVHVWIGKRVALKAMAHELASSEELRARFRREASAAGMLESDYIAQVCDAGNDDDLGLYLVTELLVGEDLEVRLAREKRLDPSATAAIGYEVARGLACAHAVGVVHRDLKPGNVFLARRDDDDATIAKIVDFGVSKRLTLADLPVEGDAECNTAAGVTLGTPEYMSPEQVQGLPDLDGRSDVWSLGATLYEALCGHTPHAGGSAIDIMTRVLRHDAQPLSSAAPWVPAALCEVVHAALQRDPDRRPDAATFAQCIALAVPEARVSRSGVHPVAPVPLVPSSPPTLPAPPPDFRGEFDDEPPSSAGRVEFFRRSDLRT